MDLLHLRLFAAQTARAKSFRLPRAAYRDGADRQLTRYQDNSQASVPRDSSHSPIIAVMLPVLELTMMTSSLEDQKSSSE